MYIKQALGMHGEDLACDYLEKNDYIIVERNFRCKLGEIDIIAKDVLKDELVFIEVKTRSNFKYGRPSSSVDYIKKNHILRVSKFYLYNKKIINTYVRYDVIEVFVENYTFKINHIKQII